MMIKKLSKDAQFFNLGYLNKLSTCKNAVLFNLRQKGVNVAYSIYFNGEDVTKDAFPQGYPIEREVAFLLWWATGDEKLFVPAFKKYHRAPAR